MVYIRTGFVLEKIGKTEKFGRKKENYAAFWRKFSSILEALPHMIMTCVTYSLQPRTQALYVLIIQLHI